MERAGGWDGEEGVVFVVRECCGTVSAVGGVEEGVVSAMAWCGFVVWTCRRAWRMNGRVEAASRCTWYMRGFIGLLVRVWEEMELGEWADSGRDKGKCWWVVTMVHNIRRREQDTSYINTHKTNIPNVIYNHALWGAHAVGVAPHSVAAMTASRLSTAECSLDVHRAAKKRSRTFLCPMPKDSSLCRRPVALANWWSETNSPTSRTWSA